MSPYQLIKAYTDGVSPKPLSLGRINDLYYDGKIRLNRPNLLNPTTLR